MVRRSEKVVSRIRKPKPYSVNTYLTEDINRLVDDVAEGLGTTRSNAVFNMLLDYKLMREAGVDVVGRGEFKQVLNVESLNKAILRKAKNKEEGLREKNECQAQD